MAQHLQPPGITGRTDSASPVGQRVRRLLEAAGRSAAEAAAIADDAPSPSFDWASSGAMSLTGTAHGAPRLAAGPLASAARGAGRAIGLLSRVEAHVKRDWSALLGERAAIAGLRRAGRISCGGHARLLETRDGWLALQLPREDDWRLLPAWLEAPETAALFAVGSEADRLGRSAPPTAAEDEAAEPADPRWSALTALLRRRSGPALVDRGRLMGLAVASAAPPRPEERAPLFRLHGGREAAPRPAGRRLRVLDLSTLWAGPLATSILAECGCDVLKVESPSRPDGARRGPVAFFDLMNAGKDAAALDLHAPPDRSRFEALLEAADVVVESARPRALTQLGYDARGWAEAQDGRLWVSITGYGREREWIAFGDDAAVAAGLAWPPANATDRADDDAPCFCADAVADPLTGLHAAALVLAHLAAGRGGLLELALRDVAADCVHGGIEAEARVVRAADGWAVALGEAQRAVAPARARRAGAAAPPLRPLEAATFTRWTGRRC